MNKNKSTKQPETAIVKKMTIDEVRTSMRKTIAELDPDFILEEAGKFFDKGKDKPDKKEIDTIHKALMLTSHERHYLVAESVTDERWRPMIIDLGNCIQKEYGCMGNSEIALAGLAASAYYRSLRMARRLDGLVYKDGLSVGALPLISHLSKEIDRADRQYICAIETLRSRRQPQLNVKVQTKAAFFGENQTFNAKPQTQYETNDPQ